MPILSAFLPSGPPRQRRCLGDDGPDPWDWLWIGLLILLAVVGAVAAYCL